MPLHFLLPGRLFPHLSSWSIFSLHSQVAYRQLSAHKSSHPITNSNLSNQYPIDGSLSPPLALFFFITLITRGQTIYKCTYVCMYDLILLKYKLHEIVFFFCFAHWYIMRYIVYHWVHSGLLINIGWMSDYPGPSCCLMESQEPSLWIYYEVCPA